MPNFAVFVSDTHVSMLSLIPLSVLKHLFSLAFCLVKAAMPDLA
jgi:hypothetical protein